MAYYNFLYLCFSYISTFFPKDFNVYTKSYLYSLLCTIHTGIAKIFFLRFKIKIQLDLLIVFHASGGKTQEVVPGVSRHKPKKTKQKSIFVKTYNILFI